MVGLRCKRSWRTTDLVEEANYALPLRTGKHKQVGASSRAAVTSPFWTHARLATITPADRLDRETIRPRSEESPTQRT